MSSSSISSTNSTNLLKRPFTAEDQGPVQKKRRFSSDVSDNKVIEALAGIISAVGRRLISYDDSFFDSPHCLEGSCKEIYCVERLAIEAGTGGHCGFMIEDLPTLRKVSSKLDDLYTEALSRKEGTSTRKLGKEKVEVRKSLDPDNAVVINKLLGVVDTWVSYISEGDPVTCCFLVELLKDSSKIIPEIDEIREDCVDLCILHLQDQAGE